MQTVRRISSVISILLVALSAVTLFLRCISLHLLYESVTFGVLYPLSVIPVCIWVLRLINRQGRINSPSIRLVLWIAVVAISGVLIVLCIGMASFLGKYQSIHSFHHNPAGNQKLVVFNGGFGFGYTYQAYPVKYRIFYQKQDNGALSTHSTPGTIEVYWESETMAVVTIVDTKMGENHDNMDGNIYVNFGL